MAHDLPAHPVTCIACGDQVERSAAREYDKYGDRWDRAGKSFEYLCKSCHRALTKQPRSDLESLLDRSGAGRVTDDEFLQRFATQVEAEDEEQERRRYS